ncbi:MAG: hypothetical protein NC203_05215 [Firmicutes bacterium]|nr:hypothetical protein [[Eubacterium] siraeum]MCM1487750.1 hypothetical protein [Bacillota bacterium]
MKIKDNFNPKNLKAAAFGIGALVFTLFIYLPTDSFINNAEDFPFTYQSIIFYMLIPLAAVFLVLGLIAVFLKERLLKGYLSFLAGINLAVFIQYMFLNRNLSAITGDKIHWEEHTKFSVLTAVIWIAVLVLPFLLEKLAPKVWAAVVKKIPLFIGLIEAVSAVILMLFSSGDAFRGDVYALSGEEQYKVSPGKNIITIILDAADNMYVKKLLNSDSEVFDGYEDFTLYTNTCSVFDSTFQSLTQIYSGITEKPTGIVADWNRKAWDGEMAEEFYGRFHDADYKMNFFVDANWVLTDLEGKADNLAPAALSSLGSKGRAVMDISALSLFRAAPFALKRFIPVENIDLESLVEKNDKADFANEAFDGGIDGLSLADTEQNYFIVEHIKGVHAPFDIDGDPVKTTEYVLEIAKKYIEGLKRLGVYDDATIIVMADHGTHNITSYPASTPLFMIKEAGKSGDKLTLSGAPIYYADLMSTYLIGGGIFREEDRELFGSSIYDFNEASVRTRTANYRVVDDSYPPSRVSPLVASYGYNVIYSYDFTGDTDELLRVIEEEGPSAVEHMEESPS